MGQATGLGTEQAPLQHVIEPDRSHWLRVWDTMKFIHTVSSPNYLQLQEELTLTNAQVASILFTVLGQQIFKV